MERVETLIKKLQEQFAAKVPAGQLLLTVQMLQAELVHLQNTGQTEYSNITVDIPQTVLPTSRPAATVTEEKTVEILQVDEAEIEAELEEIKRNAEAVQKMSVYNKPAIIIEEDDQPLPTLAQHLPPTAPLPSKKEINDVIADTGASLNDKLKQVKTDVADALTEAPVRDLKKAIGINDRFLYINELFRGDESMYERSIKTINGFSILPEAEYWIQRELKVKLGWRDGNETVQQFNQLVRRRFT